MTSFIHCKSSSSFWRTAMFLLSCAVFAFSADTRTHINIDIDNLNYFSGCSLSWTLSAAQSEVLLSLNTELWMRRFWCNGASLSAAWCPQAHSVRWGDSGLWAALWAQTSTSLHLQLLVMCRGAERGRDKEKDLGSNICFTAALISFFTPDTMIYISVSDRPSSSETGRGFDSSRFRQEPEYRSKDDAYGYFVLGFKKYSNMISQEHMKAIFSNFLQMFALTETLTH